MVIATLEELRRNEEARREAARECGRKRIVSYLETIGKALGKPLLFSLSCEGPYSILIDNSFRIFIDAPANDDFVELSSTVWSCSAPLMPANARRRKAAVDCMLGRGFLGQGTNGASFLMDEAGLSVKLVFAEQLSNITCDDFRSIFEKFINATEAVQKAVNEAVAEVPIPRPTTAAASPRSGDRKNGKKGSASSAGSSSRTPPSTTAKMAQPGHEEGPKAAKAEPRDGPAGPPFTAEERRAVAQRAAAAAEARATAAVRPAAGASQKAPSAAAATRRNLGGRQLGHAELPTAAKAAAGEGPARPPFTEAERRAVAQRAAAALLESAGGGSEKPQSTDVSEAKRSREEGPKAAKSDGRGGPAGPPFTAEERRAVAERAADAAELRAAAAVESARPKPRWSLNTRKAAKGGAGVARRGCCGIS